MLCKEDTKSHHALSKHSSNLELERFNHIRIVLQNRVPFTRVLYYFGDLKKDSN